jgi:CheY-like chemotaxis protein
LGARILVIEDNPSEIALLRYGLDQHGEEYLLEVLQDGEPGLRFVDEHRTKVRAPEPCVILLDLYLPRYDGLTVLQSIRQAPALEHIRVVVLTAMASPEQQRLIAEMRAIYRQKPATLEAMVELARDIIALCKEHVPAPA